MGLKLALTSLLVAALTAAAALAEPLPTAAPANVGLSADRLQRITQTLRTDTEKGFIPGAALLISRHGKIALFETFGTLDPARKTPMSKDAIFRIYSMTKPITTVAAMMLVEQGRLALSDPLSRYIPAFKDVKVGVERADPAGGRPTLELVAAARPISIHDLMRHTSGLTYGFFGDGLVKKAYQDARLEDGNPDNAEFAARLARLPLAYQPGTTLDYSHSTDVLGRVIEVVTGKPVQAALKDMLLDPLGMTDTSFYVTDAAKHARIAEPFPNDRTIGGGVQFNDPRIARKYQSGGAGFVGTVPDYARFLQMLLNGGTLDGQRYLAPGTIAYMTADHLGDAIKPSRYDIIGNGQTFGLSFAVRTHVGLAPLAGSPGDYAWGGAGGTSFWVDPKEKLFVIFAMQSPNNRGHYRVLIRNMVYAAVVE